MVDNHFRAVDTNILISIKQDDFVVRNRESTMRKFFNFCLAAVIVFMGTSFIVYNNAIVGAVICFVAGIFTLVLGKHIEKQQGFLKASEFMNALFSSIVANGYDFTLISNQKGDVIYTNRGVGSLFPDYARVSPRNMNMLFSVIKMSNENSTRIIESIMAGKHDETTFAYTNADNVTSSMKLSVEPIARPAGFMLIRGKTV